MNIPAWKPPRLKKRMTTAEALAAVVATCMEQVAVSEAQLRRADDVEAVHRMRVGIRRLRAALSAFRRALPPPGRLRFEEDLRWLQDLLGGARDWDVFRTQQLAPLARADRADGALRTVDRAAGRARDDAYGQLRGALGSRRYRDLLSEILRWQGALGSAPPSAGLGGRIVDYAAAELKRRARKVDKLGRRMDRLDDRQLHRLRIRIKKLRYAAEFFRDLFSGIGKRLAALRKLQDALGAINDARTADRLVSELRLPRGRRSAAGPGVVRGWTAAQIVANRARAERRWGKYEKRSPRWV
jgi:CHAD domain-containing protein